MSKSDLNIMETLSISKQLFYQLTVRLKKKIVGLSVSETEKWCGLYQKGGKRFAYILLTHVTHNPLILRSSRNV